MTEATKSDETPVVIPPEYLDEFLRGYLVAALWSTNDNSEPSGGDPLDDNYDVSDIDPASVAGARDECEDFMRANWQDLLEYAERRKYNAHEGTVWDHAGHDFWLNSNGHGVGFWDRGLDELGDRLSAACKAIGESDIYVGDDGKLYISGFEGYEGRACSN